MKIVFVIPRYPPAIGGLELLTQSIAQFLVKRHKVRVLTHTNKQLPLEPATMSTFAPKMKNYVDKGVEIISLTPSFIERIGLIPVLIYYIPKLRRWFFEAIFKLSIYFYDLIMAQKIGKLSKEFDIICSILGCHLGSAAQRASDKLDIPFTILPSAHPEQYGDDKLNIELYKKAAIVFTLLKKEKDFYIKRGVLKEKIFTIGAFPNIRVDESLCSHFRKRYNIKQEMILFIGRQSEYKGVTCLLEATKIVWEEFPDTKFVFIGPKEGKNLIKIKDERIIDMGKVDEITKSSAIANCDIFCLPSKYEVLPISILDAWYFKKAVIAGNTEYLRELINDGVNGILTNQNPEDIANAILKLLKDNNLRKRLGENGYKKLMKNYNKELVIGKIEKEFQSLLD
ncbi:glycosyltransferase family 4 protein [candidate division WOR-3 bacterium]|nr:glycosyltransferase family 4 protein [candidate division WOR-3 bacterium]